VKRSRRERELSSSLLAVAKRGDVEAVVVDRRDEDNEMDEKASASFARERSKMVSAADFMVVSGVVSTEHCSLEAHHDQVCCVFDVSVKSEILDFRG